MNRSYFSSGDGGPSKRARLARSGTALTTRAVQGDITINLDVNDEDMDQRRKWQTSTQDVQRCGDLTDATDLHIIRGDLMFILNTDSTTARRAFPTEVKNAAFTTFNGFLTLGTKNAEEFARLFKFAGVAKAPYMHGDKTQTLSGVASQMRGSTSIRNTGADTFHTGARVVLMPPAPTKQERAMQPNMAHKFAGISNTRLNAVPMLAKYKDLVALPKRGMSMLFKAKRRMNDPELSLRKLRSQKFVDLEQMAAFALCMKRSALQSAWNAIAVFNAYGLIELKTPSVGSLAGSRSLHSTLLKKSLVELLSERASKPRVTLNGAAASVAMVQQSDAERNLEKNRLLWIAQVLDLVHEDVPESEQLAPSQMLVDALVATNFNTYFNSTGASQKFDARRFLARGTNPSSFGGVIRSGSSARYAKDTFGEQLAQSQQNAPRGFYDTAIASKQHVDSMVAFQALKYSRPGEALDVYM